MTKDRARAIEIACAIVLRWKPTPGSEPLGVLIADEIEKAVLEEREACARTIEAQVGNDEGRSRAVKACANLVRERGRQ